MACRVEHKIKHLISNQEALYCENDRKSSPRHTIAHERPYWNGVKKSEH